MEPTLHCEICGEPLVDLSRSDCEACRSEGRAPTDASLVRAAALDAPYWTMRSDIAAARDYLPAGTHAAADGSILEYDGLPELMRLRRIDAFHR